MNNNPITLEQWYIHATGGGSYYLSGNVYGHPTREDGQFVKTSKVINVEGAIVTTASKGNRYRLGIPHISFICFCISNNIPLPTIDKPWCIIDS